MGTCNCVLDRPYGCDACNPRPFPYEPLEPSYNVPEYYLTACPTCYGTGFIKVPMHRQFTLTTTTNKVDITLDNE